MFRTLVVAKALPIIGEHLVRLLNCSIVQGVLPDLWKKARIIPLKRCAASTSPSDFRSISIPCFLSKVLEKIVLDQMQELFTKNKLLDPLQSGFKKYHLTETALLELTEDVRRGIDKKYITSSKIDGLFHSCFPVSKLIYFRYIGNNAYAHYHKIHLRGQTRILEFQRDQFWHPCCFAFT